MSQKESRKRAVAESGGPRPVKMLRSPTDSTAHAAGEVDESPNAEISDDETDQQVPATKAAQPQASEPSSKLDEVFDAIIAARIWALPIVLTTAVICGYFLGVGTALLVLAGSALLLVIAMFWASVQSLTGEQDLSIDEALSLAAPSAELEQKRAVLRALKDLDFEYRIGKVSQKDYDELSARYRAEAKRLLQALADVEATARKDAEKMLRRRLRKLDPKLAELIGQLPMVQAAPTKHAADDGLGGSGGLTPDDEETVDDAPPDAAPAAQAQHESAKPWGIYKSDAARVADVTTTDERSADPPSGGSTDTAEQEPVDDVVPVKAAVVSGPSRRCPACETRNSLDVDQCIECDAFLAKPQLTLCRSCPATYPSGEDACPVCGVSAKKDEK